MAIPEIILSSGNAKAMPVLGPGLGTLDPTPEFLTSMIKAVLEAIELGYRMFDTASFYRTEEALGEAISQSISCGLIKSRDELFITSKIWLNDNYGDCVLPALQKSLRYYFYTLFFFNF